MIDTEALRKKVIDLAIQGKLTEQLSSDGDAESLYIKIQEEKAKLIKEGKIKKEKPLPVIDKNEIPFDIPDNWKWVRWGELSQKIQYGYNAPAKTAGRIRMVRISDIQDGKVLWDTVPYCDIEESEINDYLLRENDILFARTGGTVGKSYIVSSVPEEAVFAGYLIRTSYSSDICASFMKYFMESGLYWKQLRDGTIATAQPNCNGKTLSKMIVPFPPYAEQKRISEIIELTFTQIDIIDTLQQQYEADIAVLKSKIIDAGIQGKLTEQLPEDGDAEDLYAQILNQKSQLIKEGKIKKEKPLPDIAADEIPFEIPKNWKWVRLIDVSTIINGDRGKNYPAKSTLSREGIPFISALNLNGVGVDDDDRLMCLSDEQYNKLGSGKLQKDDIVICIRGSLGKHGRYPFEKGAIASSLVICRPHCYENEMGGFIMKWLDSSMFPREIDKYDGGSAQPNLAAENLKKFLIPLPPIDEQRRIVEMIDSTISSMG